MIPRNFTFTRTDRCIFAYMARAVEGGREGEREAEGTTLIDISRVWPYSAT